MTDSEDMKEAVALRFRAALLADRARGLEQPVAEYLERFPKQHWDLVIREYLEGSSEPEASAEACEAEGRFGPYCLISELGRGGQGAVYLAEDTRLGRRVALKLLRSQGSSAQALLRFRREAQVASRLEHPGICSIHDAGMEDGIPYIAMRYVKGETLAARIADARTEAAERATYVSVTTSTSEDESQSG